MALIEIIWYQITPNIDFKIINSLFFVFNQVLIVVVQNDSRHYSEILVLSQFTEQPYSHKGTMTDISTQ